MIALVTAICTDYVMGPAVHFFLY